MSSLSEIIAESRDARAVVERCLTNGEFLGGLAAAAAAFEAIERAADGLVADHLAARDVNGMARLTTFFLVVLREGDISPARLSEILVQDLDFERESPERRLNEQLEPIARQHAEWLLRGSPSSVP